MRKVFCLLIAANMACLSFAQDENIPTYHNKRESLSKMTEQDIRAVFFDQRTATVVTDSVSNG